MAKKYISKIAKGGVTLYLKDKEARDALADIPEHVTAQELATFVV